MNVTGDVRSDCVQLVHCYQHYAVELCCVAGAMYQRLAAEWCASGDVETVAVCWGACVPVLYCVVVGI